MATNQQSEPENLSILDGKSAKRSKHQIAWQQRWQHGNIESLTKWVQVAAR